MNKFKSMAIEGYVKNKYPQYFRDGAFSVELNTEAGACRISATLAARTRPLRLTSKSTGLFPRVRRSFWRSPRLRATGRGFRRCCATTSPAGGFPFRRSSPLCSRDSGRRARPFRRYRNFRRLFRPRSPRRAEHFGERFNRRAPDLFLVRYARRPGIGEVFVVVENFYIFAYGKPADYFGDVGGIRENRVEFVFARVFRDF